MPLLTASNLAKEFGPDEIFRGINVDIPHKAHIALVGWPCAWFARRAWTGAFARPCAGRNPRAAHPLPWPASRAPTRLSGAAARAAPSPAEEP